VRAAVDVVTAARGGQGAVREFAELLLKAQGKWRALVQSTG
jgi:3-deoxy-D-manno-octulosonate 8-phosphate phosphatase KdsC-like HAD superfamily phosphatase